MILTLLAAQFGAAQEDIIIYEGAEKFYSVEYHPGNEYVCGVYKDFSPDIEADPTEYEFITDSDSYEVGVHWTKTGHYFLKVIETDAAGCVNVKTRAVTVLPNNRSIKFENSTSISCYNSSDNSFELSLEALEGNGQALASIHYPLSVEFEVNGESHSQILEFNNQMLQIKNEWIDADSSMNTNIVVQLTNLTDVNDVVIQPDNQYDKHTIILFAFPKIEFVTTSTKVTQGSTFDHEVQLIVGEPNNAKYTWHVIPDNGSTSDLSLISGSSASILWDGPTGSYSLAVQFLDGNGCEGNSIIQKIEVIEPGDLKFAADYPNTLVCSDLTDGTSSSVLEQSKSTFKVTYSGDANLVSANITVQNPDGDFVDLDGNVLDDQQNHEVKVENATTGKKVEFDVSDSWENNSSGDVEFEIVLLSALTSDRAEIEVDTDIVRSITVLTKPIIDFK